MIYHLMWNCMDNSDASHMNKATSLITEESSAHYAYNRYNFEADKYV